MATWYRISYRGFGCSPIKAVRELGLERREVVWFLSTVRKKTFGDLCQYERTDKDWPMVCCLLIASMISYADVNNIKYDRIYPKKFFNSLGYITPKLPSSLEKKAKANRTL